VILKSPKLLHNATVEKDQDAWSSSDATYDFKAFRWLSLGEETGVVILPVRVQSWSQNATGNFDGFFVYDVSRQGISLRFNISHVASEDFFGCYSSAQLPQRSMVFNGNVTTTKGHSVVSTDLDTGRESGSWTCQSLATRIIVWLGKIYICLESCFIDHFLTPNGLRYETYILDLHWSKIVTQQNMYRASKQILVLGFT
jgi:hypothetical protein